MQYAARACRSDAPQEDVLNTLRQRQAMQQQQQRQMAGVAMPPQQSRDASAGASYNFGAAMMHATPVDTSNLLGSSSSQDTYKPHQSHYSAQLAFGAGTGTGLGNGNSWPTGNLFGADVLSQPSLSMSSMSSFSPASSQPLYIPPSPSTSRKRPADSMNDNSSNKRQALALTNSILGFAGAPPLNYAAGNTVGNNALGGVGNNAMGGVSNNAMGGMAMNGMNGMNQGMGVGMNGNGMNGAGMNGAGMHGAGMNGIAGMNGALNLGGFSNGANQNNFFQDANRGMAAMGMNMGMPNAAFAMQQQQMPAQQFYAGQQQRGATFQHYNGSQARFQQPQQRPMDQAQLAQQRARQAALEQQKAKAKASAIYAKRTELKKAKDGSDYDSDYDSRGGGKPRQRPKKRRVVDSDDDGDDFGDHDGGHFAPDVPLISGDELARRALGIFNGSDETSLTELLNCTPEQAKAVIALRPYASADEFEHKLRKVLTKGKGRGVSVPTRMFDECQDQLRGYHAVDTLVEQCERTGNSLRAVLDMWSQHNAAQPPPGTRTPENEREAALHLVAVAPPVNDEIARRAAMKDYISKQPALVREEYTLKDYQMLGLNWLNLLYSRRLSCILADEMGACAGRPPRSVVSDFSCRSWEDHPGHFILCVSQGAR